MSFFMREPPFLLSSESENLQPTTTHPNSGTSTRLAMTPRYKEGQIHYFQTDQPPGN